MFGMLLTLLCSLQAFYPQPVYDENSEVDEDVLKKVIDDALVSDAIAVFQLLQKKETSKLCQRTSVILDQMMRDSVVLFKKFQVIDWWTVAQKPIIIVST